MKRYKFLLLTITLVLAVAGSTAIAQHKKSKGAKNKTVKVDEQEQAKQSVLDGYKEKAAKGDVEAMLDLGKAYYRGVDGAQQDYIEAAKWFADAAELKNGEAQGWLGLLYYKGQGVTQNYDKAMSLFLRSVKNGYTDFVDTFKDIAGKDITKIADRDEKAKAKKDKIFACKFMSECYDKGLGVKRNTDTAAEYIRMAADEGDVESLMPTGMYYYNNLKHGKSFPYFKKAADLGNLKAAYFCGLMLYDGDEGVEQDKAKGKEYLMAAANDGHVAANLKLGEYFLYGNGVDRDIAKGFQMIKTAAEKGNNRAIWILSNCYRVGEGVNRNYAQAAQWMSLVASGNRGNDYAELMSGLKAKKDPFYSYLKGLYEYNITGNCNAAMEHFKDVEKAKVAEGKTMQAVVLTNKNYKKRDMKKAAKLFESVANESPLACYYLAFMKENGDGVKKDEKGALELLTKAADGGCAQAQCRLANKYITGQGVNMDLDKAAKYYVLAEKQHALTPEAAKQLANLYEKGLPSLPKVEDVKAHVEQLKKTKENNSLINMLINTKF